MRGGLLMAAAALVSAAPPPPPPPPPGPTEIIATAPASAWQDVAADDLLVMTLADGRRVTIALAPLFSPAHVANLRALVRARAFDGTSVTRVQDDYVAQWGDATPAHPLPAGIAARLPANYDRPLAGLRPTRLPVRDAYATRVGFADGWPIASDGVRAWLPHCYGFVGVGRDMPPDTGDGRELYAVIGHAPRHLDRNIALVGRVVEGIDALSSLPRGPGAMGVYDDPARRVPILSARLAADMPVGERPRFQLFRTDGARFTAYVEARINRRDTFFVRPAGGADICNVPVPTRRAP